VKEEIHVPTETNREWKRPRRLPAHVARRRTAADRPRALPLVPL